MDGHFLFALEEAENSKVLKVTIGLKEGREITADEAVEFLAGADSDVRHTVQVVARFDPDDKGLDLAKRHQKRLQELVAERLKKPPFGRDTIYSDLEPKSDKNINQKIADLTCIRYYPLR